MTTYIERIRREDLNPSTQMQPSRLAIIGGMDTGRLAFVFHDVTAPEVVGEYRSALAIMQAYQAAVDCLEMIR